MCCSAFAALIVHFSPKLVESASSSSTHPRRSSASRSLREQREAPRAGELPACAADVASVEVEQAEIAYATMAMITDYDCWKADEAHVTVEMVIENLKRNAATAQRIIGHVLPLIPTAPSWPCHDALRCAIMTDPKLWPAKTKKELAPLLKKYL